MSIEVRSNEKPVAPVTDSKEGTVAGQQVEQTSQSATEASASDQNETEESDTSETESQDGSEESEDEGGSDETSSEGSKEEKPKKKGGFQRRIDKLNARHAAAQQELEYWKQQALKGAGESKSQPTQHDAVAKTEAQAGKPNADDFSTHAEYVEAIADWKAEQKFREREQRAEKARMESQQAEQVKSYVERVKAFSSKTADYAEVVSEVDDVPLSAAVREVLLSSEYGPQMSYELAKDRAEFERVCKLPPLAAARELGKLESKIAARATDSKPTETKKLTQAPKPLKPLAADGKATASKSISDPNLSQKEYERLRAEQIKKRRQV